MRTVTFKSVFDSVLSMQGLNPDTISNIDQEPYKQVAVHISRRVREGWEKAWWPEWTLVEARTVESGGTIGLQQQGKTRIGTVRDVYVNSPRSSNNPRPVPYLITDGGILTKPAYSAGDTLYVEFRKRAPRFSTTPYNAGETTLQDGHIRYWATSTDTQLYGNCYEARYSGSAWSWDLQAIPFVLEQWVILAAFADGLKQNGQRDRAIQVLDNDAYPELWRARDAELKQNDLYESAQVRTYGT